MILHVQQKEKGFALLMAVIVTSTLLLVTYALSHISFKELFLSYTGKDSQIAFYAADTGAECALFWDIKNPGNDKGSAFTPDPTAVNPNGIKCNGNEITTDPDGTFSVFTVPQPTAAVIGGTYNSIFQFCIDGDCAEHANGPCAIVSVEKDVVTDFPNVLTRIQSRGYNTCNVGNPRRFERALEVVY